MYDLHSEFDVKLHKKTFINYLEVIIEKNGHVLYAIPSHQEMLIKMACETKGWTRNELMKNCPPEYYFDVVVWLCGLTDAISVWNGFYQGTANDAQKEKLRELKTEGIYKGVI